MRLFNFLSALLLSGILAVGVDAIIEPAVAASTNAGTTSLRGSRTLYLKNPYKSAGSPRYWTNKINSEWLNWGSPTEPEKDFSVGVTRKSKPGQFSSGLRRYLRTNKTLRLGKVLPSVDYIEMSVHGGVFEALPFVFQDLTLRKECLGYINKRNNEKLHIYGWMCARTNVVPTVEALECALAKLTIEGFLSPDNLPSWCSKPTPENTIFDLPHIDSH